MIQEFSSGEVCTAVITSHLASGENYDGAISIGFYPGQNELWIEFKAARMNIQADDVDSLCKQLKRAKKISLGNKS